MDPVTRVIKESLEAEMDREEIARELVHRFRMTRQQALEAIALESGETQGDIVGG